MVLIRKMETNNYIILLSLLSIYIELTIPNIIVCMFYINGVQYWMLICVFLAVILLLALTLYTIVFLRLIAIDKRHAMVKMMSMIYSIKFTIDIIFSTWTMMKFHAVLYALINIVWVCVLIIKKYQ